MAKIKDYRIVIPENATFNERRAAAVARRSIRVVTGANLPLVTDSTAMQDLEIVIGRTSRETADNITFPRDRNSLWEYMILSRGSRLYLTGLGLAPETPAPYRSAYAIIDDGAYGTAFAAYRFAEEVLDYHELYEAFELPPESPELEMPKSLSICQRKDVLLAQMPPQLEGPAMFSIPSASCPDLNMGSLIFRSKTGKLVILDGGREGDTEHVLQVLEALSPGKKPEIAAWLFTHLHCDHYGVYQTLCHDPELAARVTIHHFYCHLLPEEYYTTLSKEPSAGLVQPLRDLLGSDKTLGVTVHKVQTGDVITVDDLSFKVLHTPDMAYATQMNTNDSGVVYRLDHESGQRIMLLGDAEWVTSNDLTENAA